MYRKYLLYLVFILITIVSHTHKYQFYITYPPKIAIDPDNNFNLTF